MEANLRYHVCVPSGNCESRENCSAGSGTAIEGGDGNLLNDLNYPVLLAPKLFEFSFNSGYGIPVNP